MKGGYFDFDKCRCCETSLIWCTWGGGLKHKFEERLLASMNNKWTHDLAYEIRIQQNLYIYIVSCSLGGVCPFLFFAFFPASYFEVLLFAWVGISSPSCGKFQSTILTNLQPHNFLCTKLFHRMKKCQCTFYEFLHLNLVGGFKYFFIFIPTWGNDPIWLIFFRWVETTNQEWYFLQT